MPKFATVIAILLAATGLQSTTIHVPSQQPTIQAGIDAAVDGDTVLIAPGTYVENVVFSKIPVQIASLGGSDETHIAPLNWNIPTIRLPDSVSGHVEFSGLTVSAPRNRGLAIGLENEVSVRDCAFDNCVGPIVSDARELTVTGCSFTNNVGQDCSGVLTRGQSALIEDCLFAFNESEDGFTAVYAEVEDDLRVLGNVMINNVMSVGTIYAVGARLLLISRNVIANNEWDNAGGGSLVRTYESDSITVRNNTIANNGDMHNYWLKNAIVVEHSVNADIRNNIITSNACEHPISAYDWGEIVIQFNNIFANHSDVLPPAPYSSYNISVEPQFVDTALNDFRLDWLSACIDAGDPAEEFVDEDGTRCDLGALPRFFSGPVPARLGLVGEERLSVLNHSPSIGWTFRGLEFPEQVAYAVEVGNDEDWSVAELWESGVVHSNEDSVGYLGGELVDGESYYVRVQVFDGSLWGEWFEFSFHMNAVPSEPEPYWPLPGGSANTSRVILSVGAGIDAEMDTLVYEFELKRETEPDTVVAVISVTEAGPGRIETEPVQGLQSNASYSWRCRCWDGYEYSEWSDGGSFQVVDVNVVHVPNDLPGIEDALYWAGEGDTVLVDSGVYSERLNFTERSVSLVALHGSEHTVITQAWYGQPIVKFAADNGNRSLISGFTISGSRQATGMVIEQGNRPVILSCVFEDNQGATNGAGVHCRSDGVLIERCRFEDNRTTSEGGALYLQGADTVTVRSCLFDGNWSYDNGGAIRLHDCTLIILAQNLAFNNTSDRGNGGFLSASFVEGLDIVNNTVVRNGSHTGAAGIYFEGPCNQVSITENIVAFNERWGIGVPPYHNWDITVDKNNVYRNVGADYSGFLAGDSSISVDPLFCDRSENNFHLAENSPCLPQTHSLAN